MAVSYKAYLNNCNLIFLDKVTKRKMTTTPRCSQHWVLPASASLNAEVSSRTKSIFSGIKSWWTKKRRTRSRFGERIEIFATLSGTWSSMHWFAFRNLLRNRFICFRRVKRKDKSFKTRSTPCNTQKSAQRMSKACSHCSSETKR